MKKIYIHNMEYLNFVNQIFALYCLFKKKNLHFNSKNILLYLYFFYSRIHSKNKHFIFSGRTDFTPRTRVNRIYREHTVKLLTRMIYSISGKATIITYAVQTCMMVACSCFYARICLCFFFSVNQLMRFI